MRHSLRLPLLGCLALVAGWVLGPSIDAYAWTHRDVSQPDLSMISEAAPGACIFETYAYLRVAMVAQGMGPYGGDVFAGALEDLRGKLATCLNGTAAARTNP